MTTAIQAYTGTPTIEHGHHWHHHGCGCVIMWAIMLGCIYALIGCVEVDLGKTKPVDQTPWHPPKWEGADTVYPLGSPGLERRRDGDKADKTIPFWHFKRKDGSPRFPGIVHFRKNLQDLGDGVVRFMVGTLGLPAFVEAFVPMLLLFVGLLCLGFPVIVVVGIVAIILARNHKAAIANRSVEMQTGYFDWVPVIMALCIPGSGQYTQGRENWKKYLALFVFVWVFSCGLLGWVVHIFSGADAYKWEKAKVPPDQSGPPVAT